MKQVYEWRQGARFNADPQAIGETIANLGSPTAEQIVEEAKKRASPLHPLFDWDVETAARQYWLETAQKVARNIVVRIVVESSDEEEQSIEVRAFECVTTEEDATRAYVPVKEALSSEAWKAEIFDRLQHDVNAARKALEAYSYLSTGVAKAARHVKRAAAALVAAAVT